MKKTLIYSQLAIAGLLSLSACGPMSQDPLKEYPLTANSRPVQNPEDLKRVEPPVKEVVVVKEVPVDRPVYYAKEPDQNYAAAQLYQINNLGPVSFTAGQESSVNFEVRMLQGQIDFNANLIDLDGAKFEQVSADANKKVYKLTYTPAVDTLPGTSREKTGALKIQLQIKSIKDANADKQKRLEQAFSAVSMMKPFEYVVRRDLRVPKIEVQSFPTVINEGEKKSFSLKVTAPGTYNGFQPEVWVGYDYKGLNGGLYENNGSPFVRPSAGKTRVEKVGNGEWLFNYDVDTTLFAVPAQLNNQLQPVAGADSVLLRVTFKVVSPAGSTSDEKVIQYKIVYKKVTAAAPAETK